MQFHFLKINLRLYRLWLQLLCFFPAIVPFLHALCAIEKWGRNKKVASLQQDMIDGTEGKCSVMHVQRLTWICVFNC
jgi:hypothetical protein